MMKKYIYGFLGILLFASCESWLEVKMKDKILENVLFEGADGYTTALNGIYAELNSQEIYAFALIMSVTLYVVFSLLTCRKPFNMDKMLHRGIYSESGVVKEKEKMTWKKFFLIFTGVNEEYKKGDKVLAWSVFIYSFIFMFVILFIVPIIWNSFQKWPDEWWSFYFWFKQIFVVGVIGIISTVWFTWGGTVDLIRLFRRLDQRGEVDSNDDGIVSAEEKTE
jgi:hypothetical protein